MFYFAKHRIEKAWEEIYRNKPRAKRALSRGIDNISISDFKKKEKEYITEINRQIEGGFFKFKRLKEYYLKTPGKKDRLIQAPTVTDRIVQNVISDYLMGYFLREFNLFGIVGSVRGNTVEKLLLKSLEYYKEGYIYVLKTDIKDFFPSVNKIRLAKKVFPLIVDAQIKGLLVQYLKQSRKSGIPQGTPLSPIMANLYLLEFDKWLTKQPNIKHFRYVDDLVVFCKTREGAENIYKKVNKLLRDLDLIIHDLGTEGKTYIARFDIGKIDILGIIYKENKLLIKPKKYKKYIQENINPIKFKTCLDPKLNIPEGLDDLLKDLNHQVRGWSSAYAFCDVQDSFLRLDLMLLENFKTLLNKLNINLKDQEEYIRRIPKYSDAFKNKKVKP